MAQIDGICDRFEQALATGETPSIESALTNLGESLRGQLLEELLKLDLHYRRRNGETPKLENYLTRFADWKSVVYSVFRLFETLTDSKKSADALATTVLEQGAGSSNSTETLSMQHPLTESSTSEIFPSCGRYHCMKRLGDGTFGIVYLAQDEELPRQVAVKLLKPEWLNLREAVNQFREEAQRLATLDHPHILPIFDVGQAEDGRWYLVSKYVSGGSLKDHLKRGELPPREAARLTACLADALHHAHEKGFVHRDVKPANVLMDRDGRPLLCDFGLALNEDQLRLRRGEVSGSPAYMAPEQTEGRSHHLDGRTDVWSLGVILYEMLTGRLPFAGETCVELFEEIREREPKPPRQRDHSIPAPLEDIVLKCLQKNVADRYSTAADLAEALESWQESIDVPAPANPSQKRAFVFCATVLGLIAGPWFLWKVVAPSELSQQPGNGPTPALGGKTVETETRTESSFTTSPLIGTVDVKIWNPGVPQRRGLSLRDSDALPLRPGDQLRIEGQANQPAYLYLIWIDSDGTVKPLAPWEPGTWTLPEDAQVGTRQLASPMVPNIGWEIEGGPGMECVILLGRLKPLSQQVSEVLKSALNELPSFPMENPQDAIWIARREVVAATGSRRRFRGLNLTKPKAIQDSLLNAQAILQERLTPHFPLMQAVTFANRGVVQP